MIAVKEADKIINKNLRELPCEELPLSELCGRVLAENIYAKRSSPAFDRVCMDGIALRYELIKETSTFDIESIQKAGEKPHTLLNDTGCIEIMTGAALPLGCDTVVPYEKIQVEKGSATLLEPALIRPRQNIHFKAHDYGEGKLLLVSGEKLNSAKVALVASQGVAEVAVYRFPKVVIFSTGDELISAGETCEDWQVYSSNDLAILSELESFGVKECQRKRLPDERDLIQKKLTEALKTFDLILFSGGVSKGKFDFVHKVFPECGVETHFHQVNQRPGKPLLYGSFDHGKRHVFGLPGNPNAALICLRRFVIPSIFKMMNNQSTQNLINIKDIDYREGKTNFIPVKDSEVIKTNGSGDYYSFSKSDGFIEVDGPVGPYPYYPWGSLC